MGRPTVSRVRAMTDIPFGYCHCGCGQKTRIPKHNNRRLGYIAGQPIRFIRGHSSRLRPTISFESRFWSHVEIRGDDECWEWQATRDKDGYGRFRDNDHSSPEVASRISYRLTHEDFAPALKVCHKCDNPPCCNPNHIFIGTHADNMLDKARKNRKREGKINNNENKIYSGNNNHPSYSSGNYQRLE